MSELPDRGGIGSRADSGDGRFGDLEAENRRLRALLAERDRSIEQLRSGDRRDAQIRLVADALPVMIAYVDSGERHIYGNRAYQAMCRDPSQPLLGRTIRDVVGEETYEQLAPLVRRALAGERVSLERAFTHAGGEVRYFQLDYVPDRGPDGRVGGFYALVSDIGDRKRAEIRLRESEKLFRDMADSAPAPIWVTGPDGIEFVNRAMLDFLGCTPEQILGSGWAGFVHPEDAAEIWKRRARAWAGEDVYAFDARFRRADGIWRWLHGDLKPRLDALGARIGFVGIAVDLTEIRAVETALRESEARFRAMADSAPAPVWVTNAEGIEFVNQAFAELVGAAPDALGGDAWTRLVHPEDLHSVLSLRDRAWRDLASYTFEARFRRRDGEQRWMHVSCKPRLDAAGQLVGYVGIANDITEAKRAEAELRERESLLRAMFDNAGIGMVLMDRDSIILGANAAFAAIVGRDAEALVGTSCLDITDPEDLPATRDAVQALEDGAHVHAFEKRYRLPDGQEIWVRNTLSDVGGRMLAVVEDVTARKRVEEALRESEDRLRLATQAAAIGTWDYHPPTGELRWDERCKALFGLAPDDPIDLPAFGAALHPDDRAKTEAAVARALDPDGTGSYDIEYRAIGIGDGVERWIAARGRAVFSGREPVRFIGTVLDISERKRAEADLARKEAALSELNQSLETRIAAAIAEREQVEEALRQAQKMEAVGQLTGGIAHDFNNLLTVISGNLDLAARRLGEDSDPRIVRAIGSAKVGADRAATLTQRLLAFSRRQPLAPKPTDASLLVGGMTDLLLRTIGETIAIETRLAPDLARVEVDPNQLESAILNLAVNARDAMPEGGDLVIETRSAEVVDAAAMPGELPPGRYVVISVSDTGTGMDPDTLHRAIEPFFTTKDVGKGTGLGLSMVYGFVKQSGGHLRIDSSPGRGTDIGIWLPCMSDQAAEPVAAVPGLAPSGGGRETILVCEDDEDVRAYTTELLRELGYRVLEAGEGAATLDLLGRFDVDLLFTDVVLPGGMSGAQLAKLAQDRRPGLKVLFTTGYARDAIVHEGRLDPGVELITKPFALGELAERLRAVLGRE